MNQPNQKTNNRDLIFWSIIATTAVVVVLGFLGYLWVGNNSKSTNSNVDNTYKASTTTEVQTPAPPPSDKDENGCYTPSTVRKHYGETDCVVFTVAYTYETSAGTKFIDEKVDYKNGFAVYIPRGSNFSTVELSQFDGKKVKATGLIKEYNGSPQIEATEYSQVTIFR